MAEVLRPGGYLAVADLDAEDGSFHAQKRDVYHNGFERNQIAEWLSRAGFVGTAIRDAHWIRKADAVGLVRSYGVFLAVGRKSPAAQSSS